MKASVYPFSLHSQRGFGLMETLAGMVVFVILAMVGTKAYRGVVQNHKEADQVKSLTDAVARTAEFLSGFNLLALAGPGSKYLAWSEPEQVGLGPNHFRYRIVPNPMVGGAADTTLVGLEVEVGEIHGGTFTGDRAFATLIPPNAGRGGLGSASTLDERNAEADFYRDLRARIAALTTDVVDDNQEKLNTFSCYDRGQCCGFMKEFFGNPAVRPVDGLDEKCLYRCALGGNVSIAAWNGSCGTDFCAAAPWKTKADCCQAIATGECVTGSVCARVCLDCVGENGSGCEEPVCDGGWFNDLFDCANNALCNGDPLPEGNIPNWGNVRELCKIPECQSLGSDCGISQWVCCKDYWEPLSRGETPNPKVALCEQISSQQACCEAENRRGHWDISCRADGTSDGQRYEGRWYCDGELFTNGGPGKWCSIYKACGVPTGYARPPGASCPAWDRAPLHDPWQDPDPDPPKPPEPRTDDGKKEEKRDDARRGLPILKDILEDLRKASQRDGGGWGNTGGRE